MTQSIYSPDYATSSVASRGKLVDLDGYLVPETVETLMVGGGPIDGKKWPDMKFKFAIRDGAAVCVNFSIVSKPGDRPIRTSHLRILDLDELAKAAFMEHVVKRISLDEVEWARPDDPEIGKRIRPLIEAGYANPQAELKHVARTYCDPDKRKARALNVKTVLNYGSIETAHRRIREARKAGYIPDKSATNEELTQAYNALKEMD